MRALASRTIATVRSWIGTTPRLVLAAFLIALAALLSLGGLLGNRAYNYVQHDNNFCLSCHLMEDPFVRFESGEHRGLSCKACHQPNLVERTKMALTQVLKQPVEISAHAEVPDERCASCHVDGDPEEWTLIRNSGGHAIHLESNDPDLDELTCVQCHSVSLHRFTPTDQTCGQAGCHEEIEIVLGGMSDVGIHCEACHSFSTPLLEPTASRGNALESLAQSLRPGANDCLACHVMRELVVIAPDDEPHGAVCGTCHNPHTQTRAGDAIKSCDAAGCHSDPEEIDDDHHRWESVDLADCQQCHTAHDFRIDGEDCLACHKEILMPPASTPATGTMQRLLPPREPVVDHGPGGPSADPDAGYDGFWIGAVQRLVRQPTRSPSDTIRFTHVAHVNVDCGACHSSEKAVPELDPVWCDGCHHANNERPACTDCHTPTAMDGIPASMRMSLPGGPQTRTTLFQHDDHVRADCVGCHQDPPGPVSDLPACTSCHDNHHAGESVDCVACHTAPAAWAHESAVVHEGCSGSVCHSTFEVSDGAGWTRSVCVACHTDFPPDEPLPARPKRRGGG